MTLDDFRQQFNRLHAEAKVEADLCKNSMHIPLAMAAAYQRLEPAARTLADRVIAEWVLSDDEGDRYDAVSLIREFTIRSAEESVRTLAERLVHEKRPGAPFELQKVTGLLSELDRR